jgi:Tfp pilus assembly PilM family ATPase
MSRVFTRELDLPLLPPNDMRRLVALDIDRLTPFPAEAVYFDLEIIQRDADRGKQRVLAGRPAARRDRGGARTRAVVGTGRGRSSE